MADPLPDEEPELFDVIGMLSVLRQYRRNAANEADVLVVSAGERLAEVVGRHFPAPADRGVAGTAIVLAASFMCDTTGRLKIPPQVIGMTLGLAGAGLIEGG